MLLIYLIICGIFIGLKGFETCVDKFCPLGTYCEERNIVSCGNPPCRPLLVCMPDNTKGCKSHPPCPAGKVCAEKLVPCIGRSCRKIAKCVLPGTCDAMECPPSHKCVMNPGPTCVKTILSAEDIARMNEQVH
uniref:Follistatin-like domain-containing protein n=1 Tax=Wuchereria bancrofti TaxID=6293 RepID=A0AAF5PSD3_WUCBA